MSPCQILGGHLRHIPMFQETLGSPRSLSTPPHKESIWLVLISFFSNPRNIQPKYPPPRSGGSLLDFGHHTLLQLHRLPLCSAELSIFLGSLCTPTGDSANRHLPCGIYCSLWLGIISQEAEQYLSCDTLIVVNEEVNR